MKSRSFVLVIALSACALVIACGSSGPGGTIKNFVSYIEKGNTDAAINLFSSKMPKEAKDGMKAFLAAGQEEIKKKGGVKSVDIEKEDVKGDTADVKYKIVYGDKSEEKDQSAKLVKENGEWKIESL